MFVIGTVVKIPTKPACLLLQMGLVVFLINIFWQLYFVIRELNVSSINHARDYPPSLTKLVEGVVMNNFEIITYNENFTINSTAVLPDQVKIA